MRSKYVWMVALFVLLCAGIAVSEWYAYNVNVPKYRAMEPSKH